MTKYTSPDLLPYPEPADTVAALEDKLSDLAAAVQAALTARGRSAWSVKADVAIQRDIPAGGLLGITNGMTVPKVAYARLIRVNYSVLVTAAAANAFCDIRVRVNGADYGKFIRAQALGSYHDSFDYLLPANTDGGFQLIAAATGGQFSTTGDTKYTWLEASYSTAA